MLVYLSFFNLYFELKCCCAHRKKVPGSNSQQHPPYWGLEPGTFFVNRMSMFLNQGTIYLPVGLSERKWVGKRLFVSTCRPSDGQVLITETCRDRACFILTLSLSMLSLSFILKHSCCFNIIVYESQPLTFFFYGKTCNYSTIAIWFYNSCFVLTFSHYDFLETSKTTSPFNLSESHSFFSVIFSRMLNMSSGYGFFLDQVCLLKLALAKGLFGIDCKDIFGIGSVFLGKDIVFMSATHCCYDVTLTYIQNPFPRIQSHKVMYLMTVTPCYYLKPNYNQILYTQFVV